jgi:hypothetical protein
MTKKSINSDDGHAANALSKVAGKSPRVRRVRHRTTRPATKEPYNFPKESLEPCVRLAQALEEKNAGKPIPAADLPKSVGFHKSSDWRFLDLLRAANMFGLVTGTGETSTVALTEIGQDVVAPSSPEQRRKALVRAFESVDLFMQVADFYGGKKIPEDEYFDNTLVREFHVPRERIPKFTEVFLKSHTYLQSFGASSSNSHRTSALSATAPSSVVESKPFGPFAERNREFLDTCFVLMPFGGWNDVYYKDVYSPAIKAAGFEPLRADDLFHSGSVMEQIWEQISDAKVLVADVSGKNANVFYELGLSHSRGKPVVLLTGDIEDVPFDLRHLRVIVYDIRDPEWSQKVQRKMTTYLRNAKEEPEKSIPQPFRGNSQRFENSRMENSDERVGVDGRMGAAGNASKV